MRQAQWLVVASVCLSFSALKADDPVREDELSTGELVEQMLSADEDAAKRAIESLSDRYDAAFELDWWCDEETIAIRRRAVQELSPFIPQLVQAIDDGHVEVAQSALFLLAVLGPLPENEVRGIWEVVRRRDLLADVPEEDRSPSPLFEVCRIVYTDVYAMRALLPDHVPAMPLYVPAIRDVCEKDPDQLRDVRLVLHETESDDESEVSIEHLGTCVGLYQVLLKGTGWGPVEVPGLLELTSPEFPKIVQIWALLVLTNMGVDAIEAAPILEELLKSDDKVIRLVAVRAILSVQPERDDFDALIATAQLAEMDEKELRDDYADYLEQLESGNIDLESMDPKWRAELLESTRQQLKYSRGSLRHDAARLLRQWGELARPALPELREALESPDPVLRELAEQAIREIDGE